MKKLLNVLTNLKSKGFWGEVTITFQNGIPKLIKTTSQIKIEES